ncbi:hypothetical protein KSP39_PZI006231 [Platanthera zijinensis]|uniref:Myb/SANT-like domain-containing protein n=1 Tax=Platanthera zijinensis TaxID=2320716 RepID=A0AAP0BRR0_9ASPA
MGKKRDGVSTTWDSDEVMIFCDLCLKEIELGNRRTTHFSKDGWKNVIVKFQECTGKLCNRAQMKSKWEELRKDWKLWSELKCEETDLVWNSSKKTIDASDKWWDEKLKVLPGAEKFRDAGISPKLEEKLYMMFGHVVATGYYAWSPNSGILPPKSVGKRTRFNVAAAANYVIEDLSTSVGMSDNIRCNIPANEKQGNKRMKLSNKKDVESERAVMSNLNELEGSNHFGSRFLVESSTTSRSFSISEAIKELKRHPEIRDDYQLFDFGTMFMMEEANRETFMCLPDGLKVRWLKTRYTSVLK